VFYLYPTRGKPVLAFRTISLEQVAALDLDSLEQELMALGCVRAHAKTTPIRLYLDQHNDQATFDQLYAILRDLMEKHRV
jgi:hypothetical protein